MSEQQQREIEAVAAAIEIARFPHCGGTKPGPASYKWAIAAIAALDRIRTNKGTP